MYFVCPTVSRLLSPPGVVMVTRPIRQTLSAVDSWDRCCYRFLSNLSKNAAWSGAKLLGCKQVVLCETKGCRKLLHTSSARRTPVAKPKSNQTHRQIVEATEQKTFSELTVGQKVARVGKDATYTGVIVLGVGVTCLMFYAIGRELFSSQSPSGVYSKAFKLCRKSYEVVDTFGEPMKAFGEMTRRGRRRYVSNVEYEKEGVKHMRMKFYLEGPHRKGTVHLEAKKMNEGSMNFDTYLSSWTTTHVEPSLLRTTDNQRCDIVNTGCVVIATSNIELLRM
ncbi:hypothetical protein NP493_18g10000 [Ridgeia piscesae]|uniref:Mitochondrial import inner membrane translocase subunit Tim21 n=1 Tax=Ridgeia piscesae TaxID=27915 RepID=A0AAD9UKU6_RIDPI|nr:hypothetical protein NP493_18g10000 [Ridgeia piscesae]